MNSDKTLNEKFTENKDYPIWYYKELKKVNIDYVIWNLLKETFVVEISESKHEITFGKNRKGEIGQCIKYDDIKHSNLCSYEVVEKGFRDGKWFVITDTDTSNEFKTDYCNRKEQHGKEETQKWFRETLIKVITDNKDLSLEQSNKFLQQIEDSSYEELENLINSLIKK